MDRKRRLLWELGIVAIFLAWWFFFVQTNVNPALGNIYVGLTIGAGLIALIDRNLGKKDIDLVNPNNTWIGAILIAFIGYFVIVFGGQLVVRLLTGVPVSDILKLLQSTSPAFSDSKIINGITFGIMVAYIESYALFVVGFDLLASMFNAKINRNGLKTFKLWMIMFGIGFLFLILHVTAKGIESSGTLIVVFFMAMVSMVIVAYTQEGRSSIITHQIANSLAMIL